jgi:hypothetical protein
VVKRWAEWTFRGWDWGEDEQHVQSGAEGLAAYVQGQTIWALVKEVGVEEEADDWPCVGVIGGLELVVRSTVALVVSLRGWGGQIIVVEVVIVVIVEFVWKQQANNELGRPSADREGSFPAFVDGLRKVCMGYVLPAWMACPLEQLNERTDA